MMDAASNPALNAPSIAKQPTGIAFGFGDPVEPARAIFEFLKLNNGTTLKVRSGVIGEKYLTDNDVEHLSKLPNKDQLIGQLIGQIQGPISGLAFVLNSPLTGLVTVLQRKMEQGNLKTE